MAAYIVAQSIAFAYPDSSVAWGIVEATFNEAKLVDDGIEIARAGGIFELTLEMPHTETVDAFVSIDGTILKEYDHVRAHLCGTKDCVAVVKHVTKIHDGSVVSVWAKNNVQGVFRGATLTIRKLPDDYDARR